MPLTSSDYSLLLYTSIKTGKNFVADITDLAQAWQRTTRLVGGYWLGSFDITEQPSVVQDIFYNHIGSHIEERSGGVATWEGMIYDMDVQDVAGAAELNVQVGGYVFTANWRFITTATADGATGSAFAAEAEAMESQGQDVGPEARGQEQAGHREVVVVRPRQGLAVAVAGLYVELPRRARRGRRDLRGAAGGADLAGAAPEHVSDHFGTSTRNAGISAVTRALRTRSRISRARSGLTSPRAAISAATSSS